MFMFFGGCQSTEQLTPYEELIREQLKGTLLNQKIVFSLAGTDWNDLTDVTHRLRVTHLTLEKSQEQAFGAGIKFTRKCVAPCATSAR